MLGSLFGVIVAISFFCEEDCLLLKQLNFVSNGAEIIVVTECSIVCWLDAVICSDSREAIEQVVETSESGDCR